MIIRPLLIANGHAGCGPGILCNSCGADAASIFDRVFAAVADVELPPAVFKTCPWQPRTLVETGLRQWLRCCAAALCDDQVIGMPSHAVDEAWHGFILCTARYSAFCDAAYGRFLHHHPEGGAPSRRPRPTGSRPAAPDRRGLVDGVAASGAVRAVGPRQARHRQNQRHLTPGSL